MSAPPTPDPSLPPGLLTTWLEQSHDLLALVDRAGRLRWANTAFRQATGSADGAWFGVLAPADFEGGLAHAALAAAAADAPLPEAEFALRTVHGAALWVRARVAPLGEERLWTLQDITATRALAAQTQRLSELLELAQEFGRLGVWEREIPSGKGRWDRHVFGFWGIEENEATPDHAYAKSRVHPADQNDYYLESTRQAGRYAKHYRVLHADGSLRWIHSQWEVKNSPQGVPVRTIGIMMDDTIVHDLARSRDAAAAELRLVTRLADIVIWRHDFKTERIHYDDHAFQVLGIPYRPDGLGIDEARAPTHPDDVAKLAASSAHALATGEPIDVEVRHRRADGVWRYIMVRRVIERGPDGEPLGFVGILLDVTERHQALAALHAASERSALIARHAGIGTWHMDADGAPTWDAQMWALRGLAPRARALDRQERLALVHPDDRARVIDASPDRIDAAGSSAYEFRVRWPDGSYRWLASRSAPLIEPDGGSTRRVGVNWDITESKNADLARQQALLAERESQAKSRFLSRMSHELRTPLNAVLGFAQLLQLETRDVLDQRQRARLDHIRTAGEHLLTLIDDALDLSSLQTGALQLDPRALSLATLVSETLPRITDLARAHDVSITVGALDLTLRADAARLRQVLQTLLDNAVRHNVPGGRVTIEARADGAQALLIVSDTGRGMAEAQLAQLFEPFSERDPRTDTGGSGIGLAIARALIVGMEGSIVARSRPGHGTTFEIRLPRLGLAMDAPAEPRIGQLLYIEDNSVNVLLVEELVRSLAGLRIASEATGAAGVARARSLRPDLILVDMQLPDFDGYEVLRQLRAAPETASIRCIALSANAMPEDIDRALLGGFDDYWTKPIKFKPFLRALERLFPDVRF